MNVLVAVLFVASFTASQFPLIVATEALDCLNLQSNPEALAICQEFKDAGIDLDENVYCGDVGVEPSLSDAGILVPSFKLNDIIGSDDPNIAYDEVMEACHGRRLVFADEDYEEERRRRLLTADFGWCSMSMDFLVSYVLRGSGDDSANYCDDNTCRAEIGCHTHLSNCCKRHDTCLSCEATDLCEVSGQSNFGLCDVELARCAGVDNHCRYEINIEVEEKFDRRLIFGFLNFDLNFAIDLPSIDIDFPSIDINLPDFNFEVPFNIDISPKKVFGYDFRCGSASLAVETIMLTRPNEGKSCTGSK